LLPSFWLCLVQTCRNSPVTAVQQLSQPRKSLQQLKEKLCRACKWLLTTSMMFWKNSSMLKLSTVNDAARVLSICQRLSQAFVIIASPHQACLKDSISRTGPQVIALSFTVSTAAYSMPHASKLHTWKMSSTT